MSLDYTKIAFSSDYPVDKVVRTYPGSLVVPAGGSASTVITHSLNRKCFTEMAWSRDGSNYQDAGLSYASPTGNTVAIQAADTNTVTIYGGTDEAGPQTINYILYVVWPN